MSIAAVVLAAGEATRFGSPKQRLFLPQVLERLSMAPIDEVAVVQGAYELEVPSDTVSQGIPVRLAACPHWRRGPGASLRCGLDALSNDVEAAVVVLADGPDLSPDAVARLVGVWKESSGIVAASYAGARGHPLVIGRGDWDAVPDEGLRELAVRLVPCDDLGSPRDIDTPEDLRES